jgi:hypothetical protein
LYQSFVQPFLALTTAVTRRASLTWENKHERSCITLLENLICYNGHNAHTYIVYNTSFTSSTFYPQWSNSLEIVRDVSSRMHQKRNVTLYCLFR